MSAQSQRLNVVSSNIANAGVITSADGKTYRAVTGSEFQFSGTNVLAAAHPPG